jgi:iron complex outermembrane receptor protein
LGLNYSPQENMTLYAQYAIGINPSGINADLLNPDLVDTLDNGFDAGYTDDVTGDFVVVDAGHKNVDYNSDDYLAYGEETLTNYEIGIKGTAFDNKFSYTAALYFMVWDDAVQSITLDWDHPYADDDLAGQTIDGNLYVATTDDTSVRLSGNAGSSESTGLQLSGSYKFDDNWSLSANASFTKAEYSDYCSISLYTGEPDDLGAYAGLETSTTGDGGDLCYVLDGKKLVNQPPVTLSLSPSYRTQLNNGVSLSVSARMNYQSKAEINEVNIGKSAATKTMNLTFGLSNESWSGSFYIQNIFDEKSVTRATAVQPEAYSALYADNVLDEDLYFNIPGNDTDFSHYSYTLPTGRNFGARLNYNF